MAQKEMTRITEERISEIISRIEMYGHGAGYTADEVLEIAQQMLALRQKEQHESNTCRLNFEHWLEQQRGKIDVDCGCVSTETFMHWLWVAYEAGNYPDIPDSSVPAPGKGVTGERIRIKPHVYRELVNRLHDTAIKCAGTQQLRERISRVLGDVITPDHHKQAEKSDLERCHLEAALNIKPGHTLGIIDALLVHKMARALLPLVAEKENASLKKMLSRAERELSGKLLPEELPPADIPDRVSQWMKSFGLPWEAFGATTIADGVMNLIAIFPTLRKGTPALNAGDSI